MNEIWKCIKTEKIEGKYFFYIYKTYEEKHTGMKMEERTGYELKEGYKVFKVEATYAKGLKPTKYYIVEKNEKEAKEKFLNLFGWLNIIYEIKEMTGPELEFILNNAKSIALT